MPGWRWSRPESWHITLQFLGSTHAETLANVTARLREIRSAPVPVRLGKLDFFERSGVFVVEIALTAELLALQQKVVEATKRCGFAEEARPYHPHITLARGKNRVHRREFESLRKALPERAFPGCAAKEFLLYESFLGPGGSRYETRERFFLN